MVMVVVVVVMVMAVVVVVVMAVVIMVAVILMEVVIRIVVIVTTVSMFMQTARIFVGGCLLISAHAALPCGGYKLLRVIGQRLWNGESRERKSDGEG